MKQEDNNNKPPLSNYLKYSGLGFQLAGTIGLGVFIGYELDKWLKTPGPYFTMGCSILFLIVGFYFTFKELLKK